MSSAAAGQAQSAAPIQAFGSDPLSFIAQYGSSFASSINVLVASIDDSVILILKSAFVLVLVLGVLLYYTRIGRRWGRDLIEGGVVIGIFITFGIPYIQNAFC